MWADALHEEIVEAVAMRIAVKFASIGQDEAALAVVRVCSDNRLPQLGGARVTERAVERDEVVRLLAAAVTIRRNSVNPEIPAILCGCLRALTRAGRRRISDVERVRLSKMGVVSHEPEANQS